MRNDADTGVSQGRFFRFALLADTHIIDEFYEGPEANALDSESIFRAHERFAAARDRINALEVPAEMTFVLGDLIHGYPSTDWDFYFQKTTRIDHARRIIDGFRMPVYPGFGNHDYQVPEISLDFSHALFKEKLGMEPYYSVSHRGWNFIHVNNFLGETWVPGSPRYNLDFGSLGEEQLNWLEAELERREPTFLFLHHSLVLIVPTEIQDYGLHTLLRKYEDTIHMVVSGHTHLWFPLYHFFGPPHMIAASTRYDENSYMIFEVDTREEKFSVLNADRFHWYSPHSTPYPGEGLQPQTAPALPYNPWRLSADISLLIDEG